MFKSLVLCSLLLSLSFSPVLAESKLSEQAMNTIAQKIFQNEASGKVENLIVWNQGENFPSLGIGHFIWYKYKEPDKFEETFPKLVEFYKQKEIKLPRLLRMYRYAPWKTRAEFLEKKKNDPEFKALETFLNQTQSIQIEFIATRLQSALPKLLEHTSQKKKVNALFKRLLNDPSGLYALIDYINFKGEGINPNERYNGEGWGLLQVLEAMPSEKTTTLLPDFSNAAKEVLTKRVQNAPKERNEKRWLQGWINRTKTYSYE